MLSPNSFELRTMRLARVVPIGLALVFLAVVVVFHAPTESSPLTTGRKNAIIAKVFVDEACPNAAQLAGTWVKATNAPATCTVTSAVVTSQGGCNFKIDASDSASGQTYTSFAVLQENDDLVTQTDGTHHGRLLSSSVPPVLELADGCSYVEQTPANQLAHFDVGGMTPKCADRLLNGHENLVAKDAKMWWGKEEEGKPLSQEILERLREMAFDARSWRDDGKMNLIIRRDNIVVRVDTKSCQVRDVYVPAASGEVNERIRDAVQSDKYVQCRQKLTKILRDVHRSEFGRVPRLQQPLVSDILSVMPLAHDAKWFYVGEDGTMKSASPNEPPQSVKGSYFRLTHTQGKLKGSSRYGDKLAFLYTNNMLVLADINPCRLTAAYLPTSDGRVSLEL